MKYDTVEAAKNLKRGDLIWIVEKDADPIDYGLVGVGPVGRRPAKKFGPKDTVEVLYEIVVLSKPLKGIHNDGVMYEGWVLPMDAPMPHSDELAINRGQFSHFLERVWYEQGAISFDTHYIKKITRRIESYKKLAIKSKWIQHD